MSQRIVIDVATLFEAASASWGERAEASLDSGLTYGERPVLVLARKREARYLFTDEGAAVEAAGRPSVWREVADRVADEYNVNIGRHGDVFLPATSRESAAWIASLPG